MFVPGVPEINNHREWGRVEPVSEGNQGNAMTAASLRFLRSPAHGNFWTAAQAGGQKLKDNNFLRI